MTPEQQRWLAQQMQGHAKYLEDRIHAVHKETVKLMADHAKYLEARLHAVAEELKR
jgi:hypothetical protein